MNKKIEEVLKNPANKLIAVDLDGTLCHGDIWAVDDKVPEPFVERIEYINSLYRKGAHIIIWTARHPRLFEVTLKWLHNNDVMYHGLAFQKKIGADLYIDDKAINVEDLLIAK